MYMYVEKEKKNQRPCNTNGLELQCNLYGKNLRTRYLILAIMSHYMYLGKKNGPMKTSNEKMLPIALYTSYWLLLLIRS